MVNYDPPSGNPKFLSAVAKALNHEYGWNLEQKNIAITSGAQTAFFFLFNILAGEFVNGQKKKILLPLAPEYIWLFLKWWCCFIAMNEICQNEEKIIV